MRNLEITQPLFNAPVKNLSEKMTHNIGGLLGLGATKFSAEVVFEKNEFTSDEKLKLRIHCDNTDCKKDVKELKMKLERSYRIEADGN